ncbi:MAG TPA: DUF1127 domain-containing protein [Stellaceae bacterium]|nr:DUF1127 domain-containing protein [Stellaceae bacterium]
MSLINLLVAARSALARHWQRRRAYEELMALDDRSLADIGIHRSQIPALVEGAAPASRPEIEPDPVVAAVFGGRTHLATGRPWLPPI